MKSIGNLAEKIDDAFWVLSGVPGYISLDVKSSLRARKMIKEEKKKEKELKNQENKKAAASGDFREVDGDDVANPKNEKKETKAEIKRALSVIDYSSFEGTNLGQRINDLCDGNEALKLIFVARATNTSKWIQYALYYMSDPDAKLVQAMDNRTREFLNGIVTMFGFDKMYESAGIADIETCDPDSPKFTTSSPYMLSIEGLKEKAKCYMVQMESRKEQLKAESEHPEEDEIVDFAKGSNIPNFVKDENNDKIIHPIFFKKENDEEEWKKQGNGISDEMFEKLEENFSDILKGYEYRYEKADTGMINLFIKRNIVTGFAQDIYTIDPGIVMGKGKFYILARIPNDTIFVSSDHKDIISKVIGQKFYVLYPNEIQEVAMDYFYNNNIYRYVDMSNTEFLNDLNSVSYQNVGKKLTFIINQLRSLSDGLTDLPRFRFDSFESADKFSIVSDEKVVSPLSTTGETSSEIANGLRFEIDGDNVIQKINDLSINYKIDKYGEL